MDLIPELNDKQIDRASEFLSNASLLSVASLIIPNVFGVDKLNMLELTLGIVSAILFLLGSIVILRRNYE